MSLIRELQLQVCCKVLILTCLFCRSDPEEFLPQRWLAPGERRLSISGGSSGRRSSSQDPSPRVAPLRSRSRSRGRDRDRLR